MKKALGIIVVIAILLLIFGKENVQKGATNVINGVDAGVSIVRDNVDFDAIKEEAGEKIKQHIEDKTNNMSAKDIFKGINNK